MALDYVSKYRNYLDLDNTLSSDPITSASKLAAEMEMDTSYYTEPFTINNVEYKAMLKHEKNSENKKLIFKPDVKVSKGEPVLIGDIYYLITDFLGDGVYNIYPTATLKRCNSFFPAITDKARVLKQDTNGQVVKDKFGDPVYIWTGGEIFNVPCIAESSIKDKESNNQLNLPDGRLKVSMKYQPIANVKLNETFKMYDNTYKITHIDLTQVINGIGIMVVTADIVPSEVIS